MAIGPGKYDDLCTHVRERAKAWGAAVMIYGGKEGWGFSIQAPAEGLVHLPEVLRNMADTIEGDLKKGKI